LFCVNEYWEQILTNFLTGRRRRGIREDNDGRGLQQDADEDYNKTESTTTRCGGRLQEDGGLGGKRPRQRQEPVKYFSGA